MGQLRMYRAYYGQQAEPVSGDSSSVGRRRVQAAEKQGEQKLVGDVAQYSTGSVRLDDKAAQVTIVVGLPVTGDRGQENEQGQQLRG